MENAKKSKRGQGVPYDYISIILIVCILYTANTIWIKPNISEQDSIFAYFMVNFFNDVGAGVIIPALWNGLSVLVIKKEVTNDFAYLVLIITECVFWELLRPFILMIFNPFHKTPKALWGDCIAYAAGTMIVYVYMKFIKSRYPRSNSKKA